MSEDDDGDRRAVNWETATRRWREWLRDAQNTSAVFTDIYGNETTAPMENRFMESRQKQLYAKLKDLERGVRDAFGKRLTTVMLTFTASNDSGAGNWKRCPVNHLDDLLGSWSAVRRQLHRVLDGRRWEYARILEPHGSGYAHAHVALFIEGPIRAGAFAPVMDAHVSNCLAASADAHDPSEGAVSVDRGVDNLAAYLSAYVMKYGENAQEAPENVQAFNTVLWATGTRRVSFSQGAQDYMAFEPPETIGEWELTHFEIDGERYANNTQGERAVMLPITGGAGLDPPPVR